MTDHRPRKSRWTKGRVRTLAWGTGGAAFIMAAAPLVAAPKPPVDAAHASRKAPARQVIERHIIRKVVIVDPVASAPVTSSTSSSGSTTQAAPAAAPAPAPAPAPPTTTTGGS
jgi:hypothetical protein